MPDPVDRPRASQIPAPSAARVLAPDLRATFERRFERVFERVYGFVWVRVGNARTEGLVERILRETLGDWMGPGAEHARDARVLERARSAICDDADRCPREPGR